MVEYVIFDMDGLLLDTESIYTLATNQVLAPYGKEMTWAMKAGCMGKPERKAAEHLLSFFPDISLTIEEYLVQRDVIQDRLWPTVPFLPGARKLIEHLAAHKIAIAVATGTRRRNFDMKTSGLQDVFALFEGKVICADDLGENNLAGKPAPDIFLLTARSKLGLDVGHGLNEYATDEQVDLRLRGLVFEDAIPGMQAGKRAGMKVCWVPDSNLLDVEYIGVEKADQVIKSLEEFDPAAWGLPPYPTT